MSSQYNRNQFNPNKSRINIGKKHRQFHGKNPPPGVPPRQMNQGFNPSSYVSKLQKRPFDNDRTTRKGDLYMYDKVIDSKNNLINEFITSEENYVKNLTIFKTEFLEEIKNENILSSKKYSFYFGDINLIFNINDMFIKDLRKFADDIGKGNTTSQSGSQRGKFFKKILKGKNNVEKEIRKKKVSENILPFCEIILKFSDCFKLYSSFISNYSKISLMLSKEKKENTKFINFLNGKRQKLIGKPDIRIKDFNSFLILPLQRIVSYKLLVQNLEKEVVKIDNFVNTKEYKKLNQAKKTLENIAEYCDTKTKMKALDVKMNYLNDILNVENLILPWRKLLLDSTTYENDPCVKEQVNKLKVSVNKKFKQKFANCYLFTDILCVLVIHKKDIFAPKRFQTVAISLRNELKIAKYEIPTEKQDVTYKYVMQVREDAKGFLMEIFFDSKNIRNYWKESVENQISFIRNKSLNNHQYVSEVKPKSKGGGLANLSDIFVSAGSTSASGGDKLIESYEILMELQ